MGDKNERKLLKQQQDQPVYSSKSEGVARAQLAKKKNFLEQMFDADFFCFPTMANWILPNKSGKRLVRVLYSMYLVPNRAEQEELELKEIYVGGDF